MRHDMTHLAFCQLLVTRGYFLRNPPPCHSELAEESTMILFLAPIPDFNFTVAFVFDDQLLVLVPFIFFHDFFGNGDGIAIGTGFFEFVDVFLIGHGNLNLKFII